MRLNGKAVVLTRLAAGIVSTVLLVRHFAFAKR